MKLIGLIATSQGREELLFSRAYASVCAQRNPLDHLVIVDDNDDCTAIERIRSRLDGVEGVTVIRNARTHGMSGTGAWNTGIDHIAERFGPEAYVCILDDDDEWVDTYTHEVRQVISNAARPLVGVFAHIVRSDVPDGPLAFTRKELVVSSFLKGNPGVQGSNMVLRVDELQEIGAFDEGLASCTDRDLMIRLLRRHSAERFEVIPKSLVKYFATQVSVTYSAERKHRGLRQFYERHLHRFRDESELRASLDRARRLFGYDGSVHLERYRNLPVLAIGVAVHNNADSLGRNLMSILRQKGADFRTVVVIGDDHSSDDWECRSGELLGRLEPIVLRCSGGSAAATRNEINRFICSRYAGAYVLRLDADDELRGSQALADLARSLAAHRPDVLIGGNGYIDSTEHATRVNRADASLLDENNLLMRLRRLAEGDFTAELPSCNLVVRSDRILPYPNIPSAEDHFLLLHYLMHARNYRIVVDEELLLENYSLAGTMSAANRRSGGHVAARKRLYAEAVMRRVAGKEFRYLGQGQEGVVFQVGPHVYKVYFGSRCAAEHLLERRFGADEPFYALERVSREPLVLRRAYEEGEVCTGYGEEEVVEFLVGCHNAKLCVRDCKPANFIRVKGRIKLIDYDVEPYNDNVFLNMCARMFLFSRYSGTLDPVSLRKLLRSTINDFSLKELAGLGAFVNGIFERTILCHAKVLPAVVAQTTSIRDMDAAAAPVTLLIKSCPQDVQTLEQNVRHIVRQLSTPRRFKEVLLSIDPRPGDYLREYHEGGRLDEIVEIAVRLRAERVIDRYVIHDEKRNREINARWFGIDSPFGHTAGKVPLASQLAAFEACGTDLFLQADSDVLIGRKDARHDYLADMMRVLEENPKVVSVGFNIYQRESRPYCGFENGGFVPEVRLGLFDLRRMQALCPLPNELDVSGRLVRSWYRAMEQKQRETGFCSVRGGNDATYYIHPQNYRKKRPASWMAILDRVEQNHVPELQYGHFDCEGSATDWCNPKRREAMVVVSVFRNVSPEKFRRFWISLMMQSRQDFGIVLHDDCSDNGLELTIGPLIAPVIDRVTYIRSRTRTTRMESEYRVIHDYVADPQAIIVMVDGDDALIGTDALEEIWRRYDKDGADVVVGREHQTYRIQPHYRYPANFAHPRLTGGNVWQHPKTFRKYLFDSIPQSYLMHKGASVFSSSEWYETVDDFAMMVPIVEMSTNPMQLDRIHYFYERDPGHLYDDVARKERFIGEILSRPELTRADVVKGRRCFRPTFRSIEIDITYDCDLKCAGCNRLCAQVPSRQQLERADVMRFIRESRDLGIRWESIGILGGEPTLHSEFLAILGDLQVEYVDAFSPETVIRLVSNRFSARARRLCEEACRLRSVRLDRRSAKTGPANEDFTDFTDAPVDNPAFAQADFAKGCWVTERCGLGFNGKGYYACALCGSIDRVRRMGIGVGRLEDLTEEVVARQLNACCRYCGNYSAYGSRQGDLIPRSEKAPFRNIVSPAWRPYLGRT